MSSPARSTGVRGKWVYIASTRLLARLTPAPLRLCFTVAHLRSLPMNLRNEILLARTAPAVLPRLRRRRRRVGVGVAAERRPVRGSAGTSPVARRSVARRRSRTSRPRPRASSTCTWPARPSTLDLFDYKPKLNELNGQPCPDSYIQGPAVRLHQGQAQAARHAAQVRQVRQVRPGDVRDPAAPGDGGRRTVHRPLDVHRAVQSRPGPAVRPHRLAAPRPAGHGRVAVLRPGHREPESAGLLRAGLRHQRRRTAARRCGAAAFCRRSIRACSCARRATRCCSCRTPTAWTRRADARIAGHAASAQPDCSSTRSATRKSLTRIAQYETGLPDADERAGSDGHREGDRKKIHEMYGAKPGQKVVRQQLPAGPPAGARAACASCSFTTGAGTATANRRPATFATASSIAARRPTSPSRPSSTI